MRRHSRKSVHFRMAREPLKARFDFRNEAFASVKLSKVVRDR